MVAKEIFKKCTVARLGVPLTRHGQNDHWHAIMSYYTFLPIVLCYQLQGHLHTH